MSDLEKMRDEEAQQAWGLLGQSAKKKARKINFRNWWNDKGNGRTKDDSDEKDKGDDETVVIVDYKCWDDSWGPKWSGEPPPSPPGGIAA